MVRKVNHIARRGMRRLPPPPPAPPQRFHLAGDALRTIGIIRLLLETPTGFGIFSFDGTYLKKDHKDIWSYFIDELWLQNVIWLKEFLPFENKSSAINLETGDIHANLIEMLKKWCDSKETLLVERAEYKTIIERNMEITCRYDDDVEEAMWGLKNNMHFLVPEEKTKTVLTNKVCLPMSKGFEMFLSRYRINMKPEMIDKHIAQEAAILHRTDLAIEKHSVFFDLVRKTINLTSGIGTTDWSPIKLATAAVMICHPDKIPEDGDCCKIISPYERSKIKQYASQCGDALLRNDTWLIYRNVLFLSEKKSRTAAQLTLFIKMAEIFSLFSDSQADAAFKSFVMSEPLSIPEKIESSDMYAVQHRDDTSAKSKQADETSAKNTKVEEIPKRSTEIKEHGTKDTAAKGDTSANSKLAGETSAKKTKVEEMPKRSTEIEEPGTKGTEAKGDTSANSKQPDETSAKKTKVEEIPEKLEKIPEQSMEINDTGDKGESTKSKQADESSAKKTKVAEIPGLKGEKLDFCKVLDDQYKDKTSRRKKWPFRLLDCCRTVQ